MSEGNKVDYKCSVLFGNENQQVEWEWRKNDTVLTEIADKLTITNNQNETVLTISNVVDADKGEYECHLRNQWGEHSEKVQLRVKGTLFYLLHALILSGVC